MKVISGVIPGAMEFGSSMEIKAVGLDIDGAGIDAILMNVETALSDM